MCALSISLCFPLYLIFCFSPNITLVSFFTDGVGLLGHATELISLREIFPNYPEVRPKFGIPTFMLNPRETFVPNIFFFNNLVPKPSSFSNFHSHLANSAMLNISMLVIPRPPCCFGRQQVFQFTRWYFLLSSSDCHTILAL